MTVLDNICTRMIEYNSGDPGAIQHFIKVHSFAALIGRMEGLDERTLFTLEAAAYVHDIGIKPAMEKYGSAAGPYQEELGEAPARELLTACGVDADTAERVAYLVAHHHTYTNMDGADYQILVEADFLVNLFEGGNSPDSILSVYENIFRTASGRELCKAMFGLKVYKENKANI